ncbi:MULTISPECIES: thermonuclease family protein [unclassified Mesotoga]|uniref:thermonuclease family protein n=1 Tax=unclassified Mesotoga TaxID=1184398 RepID=UPI000DA6AFB7|nr:MULTISPECIES: thermonuclease family protein [unclassified Mesotoga]PZC51982.1 Nuclease (SNase domain protein) [Mesotoga sp. TolDC]
MKRKWGLIAVYAFLFALFLLQECDRSKIVTAVTSVIDGDSLTVRALDGTVRLIGIDAPEIRPGSKPEGQFAEEARGFLEQMTLDSGKVTLELHGKDTYGRHLAYVFDSNGTFVNGEIVRQGLARPLTYEETSQYSSEIRDAYRDAFSNRRGIFSLYDNSQVYEASFVRRNLNSYKSGGFMGKIIWIEFIVTDINGFSIIGNDVVARVRSEEAALFVQGSIDFQRFYRKRIRVYGEVWQDTSGKVLILLRDPGIEITGAFQFANVFPLAVFRAALKSF